MIQFNTPRNRMSPWLPSRGFSLPGGSGSCGTATVLDSRIVFGENFVVLVLVTILSILHERNGMELFESPFP